MRLGGSGDSPEPRTLVFDYLVVNAGSQGAKWKSKGRFWRFFQSWEHVNSFVGNVRPSLEIGA